jgi:hypothetical protein
VSPSEQADALTLLARLDADRGGSASAALDELEPLLAHLSPEEVLKADVVRLQVADDAHLEESERVLERLRDLEARDLLIVAEAQHARSLVRAGRAGDAPEHSFAAVRMLETYDPLEWPRDRILALHAAVLDAAHHPEAREAARRAAEAAYETANSRVPVDDRQPYLTLVLGALPDRMLDRGDIF